MTQIRRFSAVQIVTHALAALSILILYFTGLPITFPEQLGWVPALLGGYPITMTIHRIAAVGFVTAGVCMVVYHVLFDVFIGKSFFTDVWPKLKDMKDAIFDALHLAKVNKTQGPVYGKYSWIAKAEFWSFFSEAIIFLITGFILWFPFQFMAFLPTQYLLTARYIHAAFAVISVCGIAFHSYMVHFNPDNFRIDRCIFTGYIPEKEVRDRYPLWYEEIKRGEEVVTESSREV